MMIKRILLATLANLFFTNFALACSCSAFDTITVSELVEEYDQIFRGKLLYFSEKASPEDWGTHIAIFEVENLLKGGKADIFTLHYAYLPSTGKFQGCEGQPHFSENKVHLIFAKKDETGNFRPPSWCSTGTIYRYKEKQIYDYFESGADEVLPGEGCLRRLNMELDAFYFTGRLETQYLEPSCAAYREQFRKEYYFEK